MIVAWPRKGITNCTATAQMITTTFQPEFDADSLVANIASTMSTTRTMPSISKPTWVIQLKSDGARLPLRPKGARLTMNAVVPVSGPGRLAQPRKT